MHRFKKVVATALMAGLLAPTLAFAQTTSTSSIQVLLDQIKALQTQMLTLQQQQQTTMQQLVTTLQQGNQGDNVKILQQLLAQDPGIYPEGRISGFFGAMTARAVKRFQRRHGLSQAGNVGPQTLKKLNELFDHLGMATKGHEDKDNHDNDGHVGTSTKGHEDSDNEDNDKSDTHGKPCVIGAGRDSAPGWLKNWGENGKKGKDGKDGRKFEEREGDKENCMATTTPPVADTAAPIISGVTATNIIVSGAAIAWNTNEGATSQVEFGTTNTYGSTTTLNSSLVTSHSVVLSGLSASTTYHFRVLSKDAATNSSTSSDMTFTTSAVPDTTSPVISGISVTGVTAANATVSWTTDEAATGKISFATSTPVDVATASSMTNLTLSTSHTFTLTGLTASSTYYFVAQSKDAANNSAATSTQSFLTL